MTRTVLAGLLALLSGPAAAQDSLPEGVVLAVGDVDGDQALAYATEAGGASYRLGAISPRAPEPAAPPGEVVEDVRRAYLDADFLRCVSRLTRLSLDELLSNGHRESAASVAVLGAACADAAGDRERADALLSRAYAAELDLAPELRVTTPDFQSRAEEVRSRIVRQPRVRLRIETRPVGGAVAVDGSPVCASAPCVTELLPGRHVFDVVLLGRAPRTVVREVEAAARWTLALDPAPSDVIRGQLDAALAEGLRPDDMGLVRAAATAFGARLVVAVWRTGDQHHATIFDRGLDRRVAQISADGADALRLVVDHVVDEWRGIVEPTPFYASPWFWLGIAAAAAAATIATVLALSPGETRNDLVFRFR